MNKFALRLTVEQVAKNHGYDSISELLEEYGNEAVVPACCEEDCLVEPDGTCPHGNPSILISLGVI